ncbi:response regulator [Humibacillus xanthopallidus]|uniref:Two-component system cell cycle response regulator DivK n=1 Tax=Humibacillus xanthopallidus TaxID=412689 RepID=A0A543HU91_9MICO|nr:response regulator [Humibacillus xanthopallidus]TQM61895.1 two-component system cell cycle response regulator DivK [Humibacillus xanthopallidus]
MSRPPTVLLVEDNPRNLKLARDVLEYGGFVVVIATTGEEAVERSRTTLPDVILMDLQLPGIDGYAALELIRGHELTAHIPVVALTAFAMARDRERVLASGFAGYLEKPISVREFPAQVRRHLPRGDDGRAT